MASSPGPKELALKAQREARASGVAVKDRPKPKGGVQKARTASPSQPVGRAAVGRVQSSGRAQVAGGGKVPPMPPAAVAASGEGPFIPVTYSLDQELIDRVSDWAHERRITKSAAARVLLEKGLSQP